MAIMHNPNKLRGIARDTRKLRRSAYAAQVLVNAHEYATAPYILRSDDEDARCRKYARAIVKRLGAWKALTRYTESGRLVFDRMG